MRSDMDKVLTERTRAGGKSKQNQRYERASKTRERRMFRGVDVDLRPKMESMRRRHIVGGDYKEFNDLLGPLERFLISRVGKPWNKVWSEICKVLKGNGVAAAHIKGHVKQMVGGIPHSGECYFNDEDWHTKGSGPVYVDKHGFLRRSKK